MGGINFLARYKEEKIRKAAKPAVRTFAILSVALAGYLVLAPFEPLAVYELFADKNPEPAFAELADIKTAQAEAATAPAEKNEAIGGIVSIASAAPAKKATATAAVKPAPAKKDNRLVISKIGVNAHISNNKNSKAGLNEGVWMDPAGSTPDKGSNTIIAGHRWKYLPPNNTTFYLLDKVKVGDELSVTWKEKKYVYKVKKIKIVNPDDISVLYPTDNPTLTVYTCTPLFSMKHRLVLIAELAK